MPRQLAGGSRSTSPFRHSPNWVTIVAVVLALGVCDQGNLYRVLGRVTTRGWLVANFIDPYSSIPLGGDPDDPVRVLVT